MFDFDGNDKPRDPVASELRPTPRPSGPSGWQLPFTLLRRELRWFYVERRGRVPAVGEAPARDVAAASRIAGWLSEVGPEHRGAFVLRYDGRRWPVRLIRHFGGLTSVVVRFVAMRQSRGQNDTLAVAEQAAVAELLADIAAVRRPIDLTRPAGAKDPATHLRRLRRGAEEYVRLAERAYFNARGGAPCAVPPSQEGA